MSNFFTEHFTTIITTIFGVGGFYDSFKQRKKNKLDALNSMQLAYDKYVDDANKKYDELRKEISDLKDSHRKEIESLKALHSKEINLLREKLQNVEELWKTKYESLKKAFDTYKKSHP
ncbi:MAG: hypothetical protein KGV59_01430 [Tenacibaculum sp.]|nr:hypothetical protein [Tenacibaculum sp.]